MTAPSPPTDRVVAVVELLAAAPAPVTVAEITARLDLNRSTATAVLGALEASGWVRRDPADRTYTLGPGLLGVAGAVHAKLAPADPVGAELRGLAERIGCGVALSEVGTRQITFLAVAGGPDALPSGIGVGTRLPLRPPGGAAAMPWRPQADQDAWLAAAPAEHRPALAALLRLTAEHGVALWRPAAEHGRLLGVLRDVVALLDEHPGRAELRTRVLDQLVAIAGHAYTAADLADPGPLPLSYLSAPVFDRAGRARHELQIGPLRAAVPHAERAHYIAELRASAARLTEGMA
ncbi:helix-turn-helix domain-containing protein [Yinghuangia soli]|uniref:Helix-turn-helix domain-containing protein n=1 Tax=Yinghuangia soli TaxID=2908204 RepID=A0AA41Q6Y6_9ACTN|nr:helix-turn-helix domain-containing protein [Yinghuangia soli]MCF2532357.1 helix-turn-helix domain-containing protein [Yinghuangia soli]